MNKLFVIYQTFICLAFLLCWTTEAAIESDINIIQNDLTNVSKSVGSNRRCYSDLNDWCIYKFNPLNPIDLLPEERGKISTVFAIYTRWANFKTMISAQELARWDKFKATRGTKFIVHGWRSNGDRFLKLKNDLLAKEDFNVIIVDWSGGSKVEYNQARANIRLVGLEIAFLVNTLVTKLGAKASDVHLIGHSLGAHAAGYAGEKIANLGQITGLDPAGPFFHDIPTNARLDPTDAQFVDVIHTDGGIIGAGLLEPLGHLDFYPNGGIRQPGCDPSNWQSILSDPNAFPSDAIACDHVRAVHIYSESLLSSNCKTIGYECADYDSFNKGQCTTCGSDHKRCAQFGLEAKNFPASNPPNGKFYFNTGAIAPYCRSHYAVTVSLAKPPSFFNIPIVNGNLGLLVGGVNGKLEFNNLPQGRTHRFLFIDSSPPVDLSAVPKVNLRWDCAPFSCMPAKLYVNQVTITSLNSYPKSPAKNFNSCPLSKPGFLPSSSNLDLLAIC
uniref:Lipase domain-containing protein n=1 Tax=Daphnia galeata TaxID=27404 RepID=A0A8J2RMZ9_9CRUS|nr:unnamed protein product [Daphnia galeata]